MKRATGLLSFPLSGGKISIHALVKRATLFNASSSSMSLISIHALVKRATLKYCTEKVRAEISIHALVKRATKDEFISSDYKMNFNPRPREEGDSVKHHLPIPCNYFNPRPREEGDVINFRSIFFIILFQSTPS